jgi:hypothetical protein
MGDQQHRGAGVAPQLQQFVAHQQPGLLVQRAEGFVQQQQPRPGDQRAGDAQALAHAARKLCRVGMHETAQPHERQRVLDALADLAFRQAGAAQSEGRVVVHRQPRKAGVLLEHDAHAVGHLAAHGPAFEFHGPCGWQRQAAEHIEQGGLAAARGPDHGKEFALAQVEVDRTERVHRLAAGAWRVHAGDAAQARMGRRCAFARGRCRAIVGRGDGERPVHFLLRRSAGR